MIKTLMNINSQHYKKVLIIGGGFSGVQTALTLSKKCKNVKIQLVNDKPHFEYHAALYRVVTGKSPLELCIPLNTILKNKNIEINIDSIKEIDLYGQRVVGQSGSHYTYDYVVLALGSETNYFNIPGIKEYSYGFKSITEALRLKRHLHSLCEELSKEENKLKSKVEFVVIGAGASGTELSGELAIYLKKLFDFHQLDYSQMEISLLDSAPRILSALPESFTSKIHKRLEDLGIKIEVDSKIMKENIDTLFTKKEEIHTKTVVWTAGIETNRLYKAIKGLEFDQKGKVLVEPSLLAKNFSNVFVGGDAASIEYAGMAQTALGHGITIANNILHLLHNKNVQHHISQKPNYAIPVGSGWAATLWNGKNFYGKSGWILRRLADLRFFLHVLSPGKAWLAWRSSKKISESCPVCSEAEKLHIN